jgi:hypothetical protein
MGRWAESKGLKNRWALPIAIMGTAHALMMGSAHKFFFPSCAQWADTFENFQKKLNPFLLMGSAHEKIMGDGQPFSQESSLISDTPVYQKKLRWADDDLPMEKKLIHQLPFVHGKVKLGKSTYLSESN